MPKGESGLAGIGRSGDWVVELDETDACLIEIAVTHPRGCLQLPPRSEEQVQTLSRSIDKAQGGSLGCMFGAPISIEFLDGSLRFRLRDQSVLLELTLTPMESDELATALREACLDAGLVDGPQRNDQ